MDGSWLMPGASAEYETARRRLVGEEQDLRDRIERVAAIRRAMPPGPFVGNYEFFDGSARVTLSELFSEEKPYLVMYHVMYFRDDSEFCPMCSMWADAWNGVAPHVEQRANIVLASVAPPEALERWKQQRGWDRIRVVSDADDSFARDTGAQDAEGHPIPTVLVFEKAPEGVRHVYTAHAEYCDDTWRGIDLLSPTWAILDLLPSGRGDWHAGNDYVR